MTLLPEVLTLFILNILFFIFSTITFSIAFTIVRRWDFNATSPLQYSLEKRSYLGSTIIKYMFFIKIPLFLFFIYTLDRISFILPGAMCAVGVIDANEYATPLIFLKLLNIYLFASWIVLDANDMKDEHQRYTKKKFIAFLFLYILLMIEIFLEIMMFYSIDVTSVVDCCGVVFSNSEGSYASFVLNLPVEILLGLFYAIVLGLFFSAFLKQRLVFALLNMLFFIISLVTLIAFFGTYIYELPTHHCPFCLLQQEYSYIGYLLYALLFLGTFQGLVVGVIPLHTNELSRHTVYSLIFSMAYVIIVSLYPLLYYMKNGVWL